MILVDLDRVGASRPGRPLFADLSVTVATGDRIGVVGLNGTGKSTLLRVIAGVDEPEVGTVRRGRGSRVGVLHQDPTLPPGTVREAVGAGWAGESALDRLGMGDLLDADVATLSGGQAKRVALAQVLVDDTDLLVLDEPTNHLDIGAITWLEEHLAAYRGGLVLVTHDRHVLDRVTTRILELDRGTGYTHDGGYAGYLEARALREEQAASAEATRRNLARTELAWLRRGAPARTSKPKARIASATAIVEGRAQAAARSGDLDLDLGTRRLGDQVVELHGVTYAWPVQAPLVADLDLALDPRERLGIVGPNGSGKTTLLELIAGRIEPQAGRVVHGSTVRLGYHDQNGVALDPAQRVRDAVAGGQPPTWEHARLMERFWFDTDAQFAQIETLSGGERRRLQLLLVLATAPNVLLLDEPTNDLDLDTLRVLEDFLDDWAGALVVVSHDRAFLERTVEDVLALDGEGAAAEVPGGYAAWEMARRAAGSGGRRASSGKQARRAASGPLPGPATAPAASSGRSPSTLRRLLKDAEKEVATLERRRDALTKALADAGTDHERLASLGADIAAVEAELAAAEGRWLDLAAEAEG
ncbi:MAG TPA: ABC-F family ATP-binding cassette domain-containing protein [Acidimicrobiales bacterium]|nr:ABC-F family ATP-binding cassette domain-containing protein [Acidimicrobiales bacterium]